MAAPQWGSYLQHPDNSGLSRRKDLVHGQQGWKTLYAIYTIEDNETLPNEISWTGNLPKGKITLLQTGKKVSYTCRDNRVTVQLPKGLKCESLAFRFQINTNQR